MFLDENKKGASTFIWAIKSASLITSFEPISRLLFQMLLIENIHHCFHATIKQKLKYKDGHYKVKRIFLKSTNFLVNYARANCYSEKFCNMLKWLIISF